jgi:exodeoxyribonuclease VII large subunit
MSETIAGRIAFSLREVALEIQQSIQERHSDRVWVKAEMNKLNLYPHSGHCYPELVEKHDGRVIAQMRANLWKDDYNRINRTFLEILKEPLREGITILFEAKVTFDPVYGLALRIFDIDPSFSLGELERERRQAIAALKKEGIFDRNRETFFPLLPQRIAVISVETSKGYADFTKVIGENPWGYRFFLMLFPALLQGDQAAEQIIAQLGRIRRVEHHFDAVAIIRGGGGDVGLSCYNNLELAREVALFPLPVLTGIGHSTNETVTELVAYRNAITPTELADLLIQRFHNFSVPVKEAERTIGTIAMHLLSVKRTELSGMRTLLAAAVQRRLLAERKEIGILETNVRLTDPVHVLKRGFSITLKDGKPVTRSGQVEQGDEVETRLYKGTIRSIIK